MVKSKKNQMVGLGAGGHAKVLLEILLNDKSCQVLALLEAQSPAVTRFVHEIPVLGEEDYFARVHHPGVSLFFLGVGVAGGLALRSNLFYSGRLKGMLAKDVIHLSAIISRSARLGEGVFIGPGAIVNTDAYLGENVCVNSGAIVEHDCRIGSHTFISPNATLGGAVEVGEHVLIGLGATILPGLKIGSRARVGAGSVVTQDVKEEETVVGVPAKQKK